MSQTDDRVHPKLPVTAEVGSEGGSFSDPTHQVASFEQDVARTDRGQGGNSSVATQAIRSETIAGGGLSAGPDPNHGMIRYPTEPPSPPSATEGRRFGANWRAGAVGAAAGAAAVLGYGLLRRRRTDRKPE